jgi:hypothetical protein
MRKGKHRKPILTIDEAIEYNESLSHDLIIKDLTIFAAAVQLGAEALKRIQQLRAGTALSVTGWLPGETNG